MDFLYNSLSEHHKQPFGCLTQHELCRMMVSVPKDCPVQRLEVVLNSESGYGMRISFTREGETQDHWEYRTEFTLPRRGLYFYYFHVDASGRSFDLFRCGETGVSADGGEQWQVTCYPEGFRAPDAFCGAVMYQIFPDRFFREGSCDLTGKLEPYWVHDRWGETPHYLPDEHGEILNNDFFGGNLNGILTKLGYLKSLHVDVIYLNPISMAYSNHRYDTADYRRIDPMLGTDEDFSALCREAHALGMKVILDGVYSHTGSNSIYFDRKGVFGHGAYSDPDSPYRSWFDFQQYPDRYTSWWGIQTLPCVNEMNESYLDYIIRDEDSVIAHWLSLGADGFRLDVADELPDAFIAAFRARVKELKPDALLMGEVWEDASNKISYSVRRTYFSEGELDSVMNYPFRNAILGFMAAPNGDEFRRQVMTIVDHYPAPVLHSMMNSLSTHDTPRILTLLGDSFSGSKQEKAERYLNEAAFRLALAREKAAAVLQFALPGSPCIYYGDEAGLQGFEDPFNRRCYPWGNECAELLEFYRALTSVKHHSPALKRGGIAFEAVPQQCVCFTRRLDGQSIRIWVNGGQPLTLPAEGSPLLLHNSRLADGTLTLDQWGAAILLQEETLS